MEKIIMESRLLFSTKPAHSFSYSAVDKCFVCADVVVDLDFKINNSLKNKQHLTPKQFFGKGNSIIISASVFVNDN